MKTIALPRDVEREIHRIAVEDGKPAAIKTVAELTGATLRISKNYVDYVLMTKRAVFKSESKKTG